MIPSNARILVCPNCGGKKEVLSLVSGNTIGQTVWSDCKRIAPMLPQVSFVQKCPDCGTYYLLSRQKDVEEGQFPSFELGNLAYSELKEAWQQLSVLPDLTEDEEQEMLFMQLWAFNDTYTRDEQKPIPLEEQEYIRLVIDKLLNIGELSDLVQAELLREAGRFDEAIALLEALPVDTEAFLRDLQQKIMTFAKAHDTRPFVINH